VGSRTAAEELVERFAATWERGDVEEMLAFFADDAVYHNIPLQPAVGIDAIREHMSDFYGKLDSGIRPEVHHQLADGPLVMMERTDHFAANGQDVSLPICGVFEIEDGRIKHWREYFDMSRFASQ
jgi:limonene-1,2-epoxide hydrolase